MKKSFGVTIRLIILMLIAAMLTSCGKDNQIKTAEAFIHLQINCETYKNTNEQQVKEKFMAFMTEEGYNTYFNNYFLYMYPELFNQLQAESAEIKKIKCKSTTKSAEGDNTCIFEVKYVVVSKEKKVEMVDNISITMNKEGKMTSVILINTSDIIQKLLLDVKVQ